MLESLKINKVKQTVYVNITFVNNTQKELLSFEM